MPRDYHFDKKREGQNFQKLKIKDIFAPKFDKASVCLEIYGAWRNKAAEELSDVLGDFNELHQNEAEMNEHEVQYEAALRNAIASLKNDETSATELTGSLTNLFNTARESTEITNDEAAREMLKTSQELLMSHLTIRRWMRESGLVLSNGVNLLESSPKDISSEMKKMNDRYSFHDDTFKSSKKHDAEIDGVVNKIFQASRNQINMIKKMNEAFGINLVIDTSKKSPDKFIRLGNKPTTYDLALKYFITKAVVDTMSIDSVTKKGELKKVWDENCDFEEMSKKAHLLAKNPIFKSIVKDHKYDIYRAWTDLNENATSVMNESKEIRDSFKRPSVTDYIHCGNADNLSFEEKRSIASETSLEVKYLRLTDVLMHRALCDKNNKEIIMECASGQYDRFEVFDKIHNFLKGKKVLGNGDYISSSTTDDLEMVVNGDNLYKQVIKNAVQKIKPVELKEQVKHSPAM